MTVDERALSDAEDEFMRLLQGAASSNPALARYVANNVLKKLSAIVATSDGVDNATIVSLSSGRSSGSAMRAPEIAPEVVRDVEPAVGALFSSSPHAKCLYTAYRGIAPWIAEFVILRMLQVSPPNRWHKQGLFDHLSETFEIGTAASFATRLHNMRRVDETITWEEGRHGAPLELTAKGIVRCDDLMMHRHSRISEVQYGCLARYAEELQLKPRGR